MQILELLEGLTSAEINKLEKQIRENFRKETLTLFQELKKCMAGKKTYDREAVFKQVFSRPYTQSKSYLLKNEIRSLKKILQQFLVDRHIEDKLKNDPSFFNISLMKELAKRGVKTIFEPEIEQLTEAAQAQNDLSQKLELTRLKKEYYATHSFTPIESYIEFLKSLREDLIKMLLIDIRKVEVDIALQSRIASYKAKGILFLEDKLDADQIEKIDLGQYETDLARFLKMKTQSLALSGEAKLSHDMELLLFAETEPRIPSVDDSEINALMVEVIDLCGRLGRIAEAEKYFDRFLNNLEKNHKTLEAIDHRYITIKLVNFGRWQAAIDHYHKHEQQILSSKLKLDICHTICYAFLFLKQTKPAVTIAHEYLNDDHDRFRAAGVERLKRTIYIFAFLLDDDLDAATREWQNYTRTAAYKSVDSIIGQHIVQYLETYIKIANGRVDAQKSQLNGLLAEMKTFTASLRIYCLPIEWLIYYVAAKNA